MPETCSGTGTPSSGDQVVCSGLPPSLPASKLLSGPGPSLVRKYTCCAEVLANPTVAPRQDTHAYISDLTLKDQDRAPFLPPRGARSPWLAITHHFFMGQPSPGRFCDFASQPALNIKIFSNIFVYMTYFRKACTYVHTSSTCFLFSACCPSHISNTSSRGWLFSLAIRIRFDSFLLPAK